MTLERFAKAASCRETEKGKDDGQSHRTDSHYEEHWYVWNYAVQ